MGVFFCAPSRCLSRIRFRRLVLLNLLFSQRWLDVLWSCPAPVLRKLVPGSVGHFRSTRALADRFASSCACRFHMPASSGPSPIFLFEPPAWPLLSLFPESAIYVSVASFHSRKRRMRCSAPVCKSLWHIVFEFK